MRKKNSTRVHGWPKSSIIASPASFLLNLMVDGVNYCFGLFLLPLVETFDVGSASVSLVCFVLERFGQTSFGSWESSQRSLINNNTQVGSLCVGILSLLAPGTAWLTDRFGARLVQNFTLHTSNPNMASAISQEASSLVRGVTKTKTSVETFIGK